MPPGGQDRHPHCLLFPPYTYTSNPSLRDSLPSLPFPSLPFLPLQKKKKKISISLGCHIHDTTTVASPQSTSRLSFFQSFSLSEREGKEAEKGGDNNSRGRKERERGRHTHCCAAKGSEKEERKWWWWW